MQPVEMSNWPVASTIVDRPALERWMDGQGLEPGQPVAGATLLEGGTQNVLLRFDRGPRTFVLRRPPEHKRKNSDETMRREARVLTALAGSEVPHPGFIAGCDDLDVMGAAFYLMESIDGFAPTTGLPELHAGDEAIQHRMGLEMAEAIAALAAVDHEAAGLGDLGKPGYLERQVPRWISQLESYNAFDGYDGADLPGVQDVATWLEERRPREYDVGIIHGDFHFANVMFDHDSAKLLAVVDWELATIGDPLIDLGQLIATFPGADSPIESAMADARLPSTAELVDHYAAHSHRDLTDVDWYVAMACFRLGIILEGTNARAAAGKAPRDIGDQLHTTATKLFQQACEIVA